ncbi:hypothetical protein BDFG_08922 [Blastomyces dermatitidis ATCC 26199]|nr:hypothetical protein BDFG_08922 [Blastomyces dermatitidis ATCC 26199]
MIAAEQEQLRQEEKARADAEQYAAEQEQLRQEKKARAAAEQYAAEQEQLRQEEKEARVTVEQYAVEQEQLRRDVEEAAAEQCEEEERHTVERAEQEQVQKKAEERAAIEHVAGKARLQQEVEERAVAEQADHEQPAREAAEPVQLQPEKEERAAVPTAAEKMHTSQLITQLDFAPFMPIKGDGAHSIIDPASTDTAGLTQLKVSQTQQGKLRRPEGISKASERGVSQGTARRATAEQSLKTGNRLQHSQPESQLQEASRLEDVSTGARTITIIFKAREQGN